MCDCYETRCAEKGCKVEIPIHISDFCLEREAFKAYCGEHLPVKRAGVTVRHLCTKNPSKRDKYSKFKKGITFYTVFKKGTKCEYDLESAVTINDAGWWEEKRI